jgi:hypothetical protein
LREDAQKLKEEKTTLEGMIQSRDELILEMANEYGLNRMGENNDGEDEDEDDDDEGNIVAPPAPSSWSSGSPPLCGSLDHVTNVMNTISHWHLIDDHTHTAKVRVPTKQPWDTDKKRGLAIP